MNAWQSFVIDNWELLAVQVTVVLCVAAVVDRLARRASAAWRHAIWAAAVSLCLGLPFACICLPELAVVPGSWAIFQEETAPVNSADTAGDQPSNATSNIPLTPSSYPGQLPELHAVTHQPEIASPPAIATWLCRIWLVGVCIGLTRLLVSCGRMRWLIRSGRKADNQQLVDLSIATAEQLQLKRTPQLIVNSELHVPLAFGIFRPVVVIGSDVDLMTEADQQAVLLHEQGHLKRNDLLWQWVLGLAQSVFWIHPLMWYASYRMTTLREYACDDLVISQTRSPQSYASLLVAIAGRVRQTTSAAIAVTMTSARPTEQRIRRLFNAESRQTGPGRRVTETSIAAVVALGLVVSLFRTTNAATPIDESTTRPVEQPATATETPVATAPGKNASVQPAKVDVTFVFGKHVIIHIDGKSRRVVSDDEVFQIIRAAAEESIVRLTFASTNDGLLREKSLNARKMKLYGELHKKGRSNGMCVKSLSPRSGIYWDSIRTDEDLAIRPDDLKQGHVLTPDGDPAAVAQVLVLPHEDMVGVSLTEGRLSDTLGENSANTDAEGNFRIDPRDAFWIAALHPTGFAIKSVQKWNSERQLQLQPWAEIRGNVFGAGPPGADEGLLLSDAPLSIRSYPVPGIGFSIHSTQLDGDGRFHRGLIPPGVIHVGRSYATGEGTSVTSSEFKLKMKPGENQVLIFPSDVPLPVLRNIERMLLRLRNQK